MGQFSNLVGFALACQGDPRTERASKDAERMCAELFDGFYAADDRTEHLAMLAYLAMDIAANVDDVLFRASLRYETEE